MRYNRAHKHGGDLDSTTDTNPAVHAVLTAKHVNPKL